MLLGAWGTRTTTTAGGAGAAVAQPNPVTPAMTPNPEEFLGHHHPHQPPLHLHPAASSSSSRRRAGAVGSQLRYWALLTAFGLYLILGASVFSSIEAPAMEAIAQNVDQLRGKFLARHPNVKGEFIVKL